MDNDLNQNKLEFRTLGMTMESLSIRYALFLILWGIIVSLLSNSDSFTSYIPSILGLPILIFAYLSIKFVSKKKLFMHIVVFFGLIIFIGGLDFLRSFVLCPHLIYFFSSNYNIDCPVLFQSFLNCLSPASVRGCLISFSKTFTGRVATSAPMTAHFLT